MIAGILFYLKNMHQTKFKALYTLLSPKEKQKFYAWLQADLGAGQAWLIKILEFTDSQQDKYQIWERVFPNRAYKDEDFRKYSQRLTSYLEEFLAIKAFRKDRARLNLYFLEELTKRNAGEAYQKSMNKYKKQLHGQKIQDSHHFLHNYQLAFAEYEEIRRLNLQGSEQVALKVNTAFDSWWVLEKLKLALVNMSHSINNVNIPTTLLDPIIALLENDSQYLEIPVIRVYYQAYQLAIAPSLQKANALRKDLETFQSKLEPTTNGVIFTMLLNYYIQEANKYGTPELATSQEIAVLFLELEQMYALGIEQQYLFEHKHLPVRHYNNLISIALRFDDFAKAERYLSLQHYLSPSIAEESHLFNQARIYFSRSAFQDAIDTLRQQSSAFQDNLMEIRSRILLIKARYERNDPLLDDDLVDSTRNLIRTLKSKRMLKIRRYESYKNALRFILKLLKMENFRQKELKALREELRNQFNLVEKAWLLEKVEAKITT